MVTSVDVSIGNYVSIILAINMYARIVDNAIDKRNVKNVNIPPCAWKRVFNKIKGFELKIKIFCASSKQVSSTFRRVIFFFCSSQALHI